MDRVEGVQMTNDDASQCKRCAVECGYWNDKFLKYFVLNYGKKSPEINLGYYARVRAMNEAIHSFLDKCLGKKCQIVNIGAGYDTLYWRLKDEGKRVTNFIEIDFPAVTAKKCQFIQRSPELKSLLTTDGKEPVIKDREISAPDYHLIGVDLKNLPELELKFTRSRVDYETPTLFISECVLVYVDGGTCQRLLFWIAQKFPQAYYVNYEQVNMEEPFGQMMIKNLRERGCFLAGADHCKSLETHVQMFMNAGWTGAKAHNMADIYTSIPQFERERVERLQFLDERELLTQLIKHYAVCIAWKGEAFANLNPFIH